MVEGAPAPEAKDTIVAVRNNAEQQAYELAEERMAHPKITYFWSGLFDTGLALTRGNSSTASFTFNTKAVRETPRDKLTVYANYIFANNDTTPPTSTTANLFPGRDSRGPEHQPTERSYLRLGISRPTNYST